MRPLRVHRPTAAIRRPLVRTMLLVVVLLAVHGAPVAGSGAGRLSDDGMTLFLQDEVRGPGAPRPGVAFNLEPGTGARQIWVSGDGLPTLPTLDVLCGSRKRTLPLTRAQTARELHVGLYEVPRDLADIMLNSTDCRLLLTGAPIPVPRELLWTVWADAERGKTAPRILEAQVTWVIDGDTIRAKIGDQTETVRYIGINAPEVSNPPQPWERAGRDARDVNTLLVGQKTVRLELDAQDRDSYGRLLAYVHVGDTLINAEMVRRGYASALTVPPNVKHEALLARLEREAREGKQGLWHVGPAETPSAAPAAAPAAPPAAVPKTAAPKTAPPKTTATSAFGCPATHPIKGNVTTRGECLYFLPRPGSAGKKAEFCFATEEEARQGGCTPAR
jgi:micrococcal nuclease